MVAQEPTNQAHAATATAHHKQPPSTTDLAAVPTSSEGDDSVVYAMSFDNSFVLGSDAQTSSEEAERTRERN